MKDRIGLPRGALLISVTPAGPVGEGTPSASGYHLSAQWRAMASMVWKQAGKCSCCGIAPHKKLCFAFLSKHVVANRELETYWIWRWLSLCLAIHSQWKNTPWTPISCHLQLVCGRMRQAGCCLCCGLSCGDGQYVLRCCERLWQSTM